MFQIPNKEQWQELFILADKLNQKELWKIYPEEVIFEFRAAEQEEPFFATIHGYEEDVLGISVYAEKTDIGKYLKILEQGDDVTFHTIVENQSCVTLLCGEEIHLGPGDFTAISEGDYTPGRGPHSYFFFRSYQPGIAPWYINQTEAELLIKGLRALNEATENFTETVADPNTLMVRYTVGAEKPVIVPFDASLRLNTENIVKDDFYVARLKQLKRTGHNIEVDVSYMTNPVSSQMGGAPFFPKICIIADVDEGYIADQCIFEETTVEEEAFYTFLANYLKKSGLPWKIKVKGDSVGYLLRDLCKRLHITLSESNQLPLIDDFLSMINGLGSGE